MPDSEKAAFRSDGQAPAAAKDRGCTTHFSAKLLVSPLGLMGVILLTVLSFVSSPQTGLIVVSAVKDATTDTGQVAINGAGLCFRKAAEYAWTCERASFGSFSYPDLPDYATKIAYTLGMFRFAFNNLAVAYAFSVVLFFILVIATACLGRRSGQGYHSRHIHVHRPLILKSLSYLNAFQSGVAVMTAVTLWQMSSATVALKDAESELTFEYAAGFWLVLLALFFHLVSLIIAFLLAGHSRIHLRDPAVVLLALAQKTRARHAVRHGIKAVEQRMNLSRQGLTDASINASQNSQSDVPVVKDHGWVVQNLGATVKEPSQQQTYQPYPSSVRASLLPPVHRSLESNQTDTRIDMPEEPIAGSHQGYDPPTALRPQQLPNQLAPNQSTNNLGSHQSRRPAEPPDSQSVRPLNLSNKSKTASPPLTTDPLPPYASPADDQYEMSDYAAGHENEFSPVKKRRRPKK